MFVHFDATVVPPSITTADPVMKLEYSEPKYAINRATSSGVPSRRTGVFAREASCCADECGFAAPD